MLFILISGCTQPPSINSETAINEGLPFPDLADKKFCRGKGYILSDGEMKGRLNFTFTTSRDTAYMQFKDLIGRKTLFLILENKSIEAWDMLHNRRYNQASILILLPFFEMIQPNDLRTFMWGEIPKVFSDPEKIKNRSEQISGGIQFRSNQTEHGPLIEQVTFNMKDEKQKIELVMINREYDLQYPHLIRKIPESIPTVKVNS
ncbi:MAG: hypothetical protein HN915_04840 [Candidatus Marinimicrobia bacterium]|uniref:Outer-membrane lipoprotein LolB n=1 Tax=uncultured bacterium FPPZ_5C6 TaxID=1343849 RepID=S4W5I9_9BACT|nr:hypothetical protein [uncultured bacterium FPPZ_5C6]MBT3478622.1 hypothetical protein [Candidatus Neomarinimicrobiota bacterium]MBT3762528.1 hypothetical protein [Candidatus Neomarinimicrobiota bacterium]MBT4069351.1 hypothetical protein [Candidatus Neomarinimicrobiota bacterium]MBT4269837.1 hypothetical protein [Candidatus Neomarinimicrobiota bacterium]